MIQRKKYYVLAMCWITYASIYLGRLNLSIAAPLMEEQQVLNSVEIGMLGSCFFFMYAIGQLVNGWLGDRVNPKYMFCIGTIIAGICNLTIGMYAAVEVIFLAWMINGYAQSMIWGPLLKVLAAHFIDEDERSRAAMILSTSIGVGSIVAIWIASVVVGNGFQAVFLGAGVIILVVGLGSTIFVTVPTNSTQHKKHQISLFKILKDEEVRKMIIPAVSHGMLKDNLNLWLPILFMMMYAVDISTVAIYVFLIPVATLIGRLIFPYVYKVCRQNEKLIIGSSFILCVAVLVPLIILDMPISIATLLFAVVALGISLINGVLLTMFPLKFVSSNHVASVSGIMDFITYIGASIGSVVFGSLIKYFDYRAIVLCWITICMIALIYILYVLKQEKDTQEECAKTLERFDIS